MALRLSYTSPWGKVFSLIEREWTVGIQPDGIEGLVGNAVDRTLKIPGQPGQVLTAQDVDEMKGTLHLTIAGSPSKSAGSLEAELRAAFHPTLEGLLTLSTGKTVFTTPVRRGQTTKAPSVEPDDEELIDQDFYVVSDLGFWKKATAYGQGSVRIDNRGDLLLYPRIRWVGAGGQVIMPSGASFTLPAVQAPRTILLEPLDSMEVHDDKAVTDYSLTTALASKVLPEPVPPGKAKTFTVPAGAQLEWEEGVLDPFQAPRT